MYCETVFILGIIVDKALFIIIIIINYCLEEDDQQYMQPIKGSMKKVLPDRTYYLGKWWPKG